MTYLVSVLKEQHESEMGQLESLVVTSQVNTVFWLVNWLNTPLVNTRSCWVNRASGSCGSWTSSWWLTSPSGTSSMRMINSRRLSMKWDQDWTKTVVVPQTKVGEWQEQKAPWSKNNFPIVHCHWMGSRLGNNSATGEKEWGPEHEWVKLCVMIRYQGRWHHL